MELHLRPENTLTPAEAASELRMLRNLCHSQRLASLELTGRLIRLGGAPDDVKAALARDHLDETDIERLRRFSELADQLCQKEAAGRNAQVVLARASKGAK